MSSEDHQVVVTTKSITIDSVQTSASENLMNVVEEKKLERSETTETLSDMRKSDEADTSLVIDANPDEMEKDNRVCARLSSTDTSEKSGAERRPSSRSDATPTISSAATALVKKLREDPTGIYFKKLMRDRGVNSEPTLRRTSNDFIFHSILGDGAFSTVYLTTEVETEKRYAMKVLTTTDVLRRGMVLNVMRERDILAALTYAYGGHPFITPLYCTFREPHRLFFALGYARHGELLDWLNRLGSFDEAVTLFYASEILAGLAFLHNCCIVHRDLKPENILVGENWHILISDFGAAKVLDVEDNDADPLNKTTAKEPPASKARSSFVGTAYYVSPEVIKREEAKQECDYWALGAIIFQMISGQPPFRAVNDFMVFKKILNLEYTFPEGFPTAARDLIEKLLVLKSERLGSWKNGGVQAVKNHPYFQGVDWETITERTPPVLKPYVPPSKGEPAYYGDHIFSDDLPTYKNLEPGLSEATLRRLNFAEFGTFHCATDGLVSSFGPIADSNAWPETAQTTAEEEETRRRENREKRLAHQREHNIYHQFVDGHLILKSGLIDKKKGLFARRRMFLLTEGPHFYYVDPVNMELKGKVPLTPDVRTEAKDFRTFFVYTPQRTYYLFDPERNAKKWCDFIDLVIARYFKSGLQVNPSQVS